MAYYRDRAGEEIGKESIGGIGGGRLLHAHGF